MEKLLEFLKQIKALSGGTLVIISGKEGSGKTTLAIKLAACMKSARVLLFDDNCEWDYRLKDIREIVDIGFVPIITFSNLYKVPQILRGASTDGVRSVLIIQIKSMREYKATYSFLHNDGQILIKTASGKF